MKKALGIILGVLLFDQIIKIYIKTHFAIGQSYTVFEDWFFLHFVENNGMAFGMTFGGEVGKLILSSFRIIAIIGIAYYLFTLIKTKKHNLLIVSISFIFAGALGNAIDSMFYGVLFNESNWFEVAKFLPAEGGYAGFLHGKVVDMFYFPIITGTYPDWFPIWKGEVFTFFSPVFNVADSSITVGVIILIIFQKKFFGNLDENDEKSEPEAEVHEQLDN